MRQVIIFGTAGTVEREWEFIDFQKYNIIEFWDNDETKWGSTYKGKNVVKPYVGANVDLICIMSWSDREIRNQLLELGYAKENIKSRTYFVREELLQYYDANEHLVDKDMRIILDRLRSKEMDMWNTDWADTIDETNVDIYYDEKCDMYYIWHSGYKMYFPQKYNTKEKVRDYWKIEMKSEHEKSPHKYFTDQYFVKDNSVIVDAGGAEGRFTLEVIDRVSKAYIVECEDYWIEALKQTFAPWKDKIIFINRFLSDKNDDDNITIDEMLQGQSVDVIKMDIEGAEKKALCGAKETFINSECIQAFVCCYHNDEDCDEITRILAGYGCETEVSEGYVFFETDLYNSLNTETPRLRRALVRGRKCLKRKGRK